MAQANTSARTGRTQSIEVIVIPLLSSQSTAITRVLGGTRVTAQYGLLIHDNHALTSDLTSW